jgi:hypothetical protein
MIITITLIDLYNHGGNFVFVYSDVLKPYVSNIENIFCRSLKRYTKFM